ncbi:hypothetical protein [Corynebacterium variabile]|uniref:hypothetical protein n=1 Tax=Corynebacterium variabile TaxID=1727 RepID=UPI003F933061
MSEAISFDEYLGNLGVITPHVSPLTDTPETGLIQSFTNSLEDLPEITWNSLSTWIAANPSAVPVLGLAVGLSQEKLKNALRNQFDTSGWKKLATTYPAALIAWFDEAYDLIGHLRRQVGRTYSFGDILVARAGTRAYATRATVSGRSVEDQIEDVAKELGLPYATRARFTGRGGRTAPCDLVLPGADIDAQIAIAAKGFDSTGSKLTDAVREIEEMSEVRRPNQYVMAFIDGIGWKSRKSDLQRIHQLWSNGSIDGMYTLKMLPIFREDLKAAAHRLSL